MKRCGGWWYSQLHIISWIWRRRAWHKKQRKNGLCSRVLVFDFNSVQSLPEKKDVYVNIIIQTLQNWFLDFGSLFGFVQERWHHFWHLSDIKLPMRLWQARHVHPLFSFWWKISSVAYHSLWLKYLHAINICIFISNCIYLTSH